MFGLFKKKIEREYWKRMKQSMKSYDFVQNNNPFEVAPAKYSKHTQILIDNNKWFSDNLNDFKEFLTDEQYEMTKNIINI